MCWFDRAYIVHARPDAVREEHEKAAFSREVERWIQKQVARQKYLRGGEYEILALRLSLKYVLLGVVVVDVIPKR